MTTTRGQQPRGVITIMDVAHEAGVSHATVSRVINNHKSVTPETHERVTLAMTRLGYVANQAARSLAGGRTLAIGVLASDLSNPYVGEIVHGIETALADSPYSLLLYTTQRRKTREAAHVATLTQGLVDGILILVPRNPEAYITALRQRRFPYVLIGSHTPSEDSPGFRADSRQGAYHATRYLIELGHRRIGFIAGPPELESATERLAGYKAALSFAGLPLDEELIQSGDYFQPRGYTCAQALLALAEQPTAIFAANDATAFGAMEAAREQGLRLPEDLSVVGFDDIPQAMHVHPPLTTVRQPLERMGELAATTLLGMLSHPGQSPAPVTLPVELIVRGTSAPPGSAA